MTIKAQQSALYNALVAPENQRVIGKCNMRINPGINQRTYSQVVLDALALTTCYHAFLITIEVPVIYMNQFWATVNKHNASYRFKIDNKRFSVNVEVFREILNICPRILVQEFDEPPSKEEAISFICKLGYSGKDQFTVHRRMYYKNNLDFVALIWEDFAYQVDNKDSKKQDKITFMHTAQDDSLLGTMRFVSKHEDTQVYGSILPKAMMNQAILDSIAYKTFYAIASGAEPPKLNKSQKKSDSAISFKESPSKKKPTSKPKPTKRKAPIKADRGKGLNVLSEVALSEVAQLKEATKRRVPDEQQHKTSSADEGTGDSGEEEDDDEDDTEDDEGNDDGDDNDGDDDDDNDGNDDDDSDDERTKSDKDENPNLNKFNKELEKEEEENVDEFIDKEDDKENEEESDDDQHNVSQESGFEQEEEDAHVTLTTIHDTQKTKGLMQSSSVLSDFTEKLLNFKNVSPADNEIASLMDTIVHNEEPSGQTSTLFTVPITVILTTILPPPYFFNPLPQQTTLTPTLIASEVTTAYPALPDFTSVFRFNDRVTNLERDLSEMKQILPKAVSDFSNPVIERNVTESLEATVLARSSSQPKSTYEAAASLSEYELTKILLDKIEERKSHLRADYKRELYDALVKSYNTNKDLFETYGEVFTRKSSKEAESQKDLRSKEGKSSSSSKDTSRSHHKSSGKSVHTEEPSHRVDDSRVQKNQEFDMGNNDEQPEDEAAPKNDCVTACAEKPHTSFDELMDTSINFSAFVMNRLKITNLTQELLVRPAFNLLKGTCRSLTELEYYYKECSKATTERLDWHNLEGKPYPFDLCKPLPLILDHRGRQVIPQDYFINNAWNI
ncbi:hypothetical protein Tco_0630018 [Tanacetum coccineum]